MNDTKFQIADEVIHGPSGERGFVCAIDANERTVLVAASLDEWCYGPKAWTDYPKLSWDDCEKVPQ